MVRIYIIGIVMLLSVSCSDFLKEYSQDLAYVSSYTDLDELLLGGAYLNSDFSSYSYTGYTPYVHMMADEMRENIEYAYGIEYNSNPRDDYFGYYTWQKRVDVGFDNLVKITNESYDWKRLYEHINVANMIIAEIVNWDGENEFEKQEISRIRGEAYFLRGAYYFWLVNLYGKPYTATSAITDPGVPLKLTEYIEDKKFVRNSVQEVYDQVLKDLDEAEKALEKVSRKSVFRADIIATYLLKSRVFLYARDWENAAYYANKVLEKNGQLLDLNTFTMDSETAFMSPTSVETIFSTGDNWIANNTSMRQKGVSASESVIELYEKDANDLRFEVFLNTDYPPYLPCNKYAYNGGEMSDVCTYRTAEA
ncbi:MAG TPA: RagB/SusD family nutrient uptake outer membrane protein, partial [Candidatus Butyricimonas faecavium]|nr:RagB/SusD family nutrient uptake outer membrane protein [Candidatus Butyricimonas faecavium]